MPPSPPPPPNASNDNGVSQRVTALEARVAEIIAQSATFQANTLGALTRLSQAFQDSIAQTLALGERVDAMSGMTSEEHKDFAELIAVTDALLALLKSFLTQPVEIMAALDAIATRAHALHEKPH